MPDNKKIDPFKPAQPNIPGVSPSGGESKSEAPEAAPQQDSPEAAPERKPVPRLAVAAGVALLTIGGLLYWARGSSSTAKQAASDSVAATPAAVAEAPRPAEKLAVGPGPVATTDDLTKAWSAKRFLFRDPLTTEPVPAMVVRLPGGEYWGLSLREPFGNCELEYVTDLQKLQTDYDFRANHPMVANPCSHTVYDLLRYSGGAPDGGLVRGDIVRGIGIRPPVAIEIRVEGKQVRAARME
jgi:hypothetical protein